LINQRGQPKNYYKIKKIRLLINKKYFSFALGSSLLIFLVKNLPQPCPMLYPGAFAMFCTFIQGTFRIAVSKI